MMEMFMLLLLQGIFAVAGIALFLFLVMLVGAIPVLAIQVYKEILEG